MLYSDGPVGSPFLFDLADPAKFLLGPDGGDVPRNQQGVALIGDPRNDVHLFVVSLHVALLRAHNHSTAQRRGGRRAHGRAQAHRRADRPPSRRPSTWARAATGSARSAAGSWPRS